MYGLSREIVPAWEPASFPGEIGYHGKQSPVGNTHKSGKTWQIWWKRTPRRLKFCAGDGNIYVCAIASRLHGTSDKKIGI